MQQQSGDNATVCLSGVTRRDKNVFLNASINLDYSSISVLFLFLKHYLLEYFRNINYSVHILFPMWPRKYRKIIIWHDVYRTGKIEKSPNKILWLFSLIIASDDIPKISKLNKKYFNFSLAEIL